MTYTHAFGFNKLPFQRDIETGELFKTPDLDEIHARLRFLVDHRTMGVLTGEPGSGKSTALRRLRDELHPEQVRILYLFDTFGSPSDFCRQIALELGLQPLPSRTLTLRLIQEEIQRLVQQRHLQILLLIDEAQALRPDVLALLPVMTNFDWDSQGRLALLLVGQSGLRQKLRMAHLEALAQRITVRFHVTGFDRNTTKSYLEHRLRIAGVDRPLFTDSAAEALFNVSQGIMRRIDTLAHHALALAATERAKIVEPDHVLKAAEEDRA